ncbi:apoptosis-stimulating of p53 protein 2-like isoform X1 [Amphiprion ocellaris]|uniref:Tumor protein p53 binding protein, 2b n=1 Tax=Amphiprion ocellaris TaxID=80972 RepID=A0A3Q1B9T2_AMPOC|nr:apoptosis-stimulating of p53 protein 2-like isoform X1 [Amphiprion ocellaris]
MMPMFLTVYLSNNDHHFNEVPITPETLCRDVVELCKEPGEADCYLAEMWRGSERVIGDGERMLEVLQRWGQQRGEVRYLLRHQRAPGRDAGGSRAADQMMKRNQGKASVERCLENGVSAPRLDVTLSELQDLATRQQQQINAQQQLLASKEQRLHYLKLQDQRQQQQQQQDASEQERLRQLRENAHNQEAKLRRVRALRGQVEQKRLSNSKLVEEIEQMTGLFQQKQRELLVAVARVEELSDQLEALRSSRLEPPLPPPPLSHHHNASSTAELERLYKELQLRNKLNQDQSVRLQQQRDSLNKRNLEVAAMDRRLAELRQRLWKKKAALQQKENLPVASDGVVPQHGGGSRVAAVGPYIQSSSTSTPQAPPVPTHQEILVKPAYPDGTATLPMPDSSLKPPPRPVKPASGFNASKTTKLSDWSCSFPESSGGHSHASTLPRMSSLSCHNSGGETLSDQKFPSGSDVPPPVPSRTNHTSENLLRDNQASGNGLSKMLPPPLPSKPKPFSSSDPTSFSKPSYSTGTFPGKVKPVGGHLRALGIISSHSNTLPLPNKQESPPAVAVRPYTPDLSDGHPPVLQKPQTLAASSIYSMYTQQATPGKGYQPGGQGTLPRSQPRVYGKPVLPASGGQQTVSSDSTAFNSGFCMSNGSETDNSCPGNADGGGGDAAERATPRPLSPTKLLPFLSNPHRNPSDADLEALRRRLHHAPRPLKKRSSITEPEGPAGPNIQKLLYQKTTLAAMETIPMETIGPAGTYEQPAVHEDRTGVADIMSKAEDNSGPGFNELSDESLEDALTPPPLPPRSPIPDATSCRSLPPPPEDTAEEEIGPSTLVHSHFLEEFPPYPPPPYPSCGEAEQVNDAINLQPPEVTGQVTVPPGKRSILHKAGSERIHHGMGVKFNPLALLLDSSLEGEYDLVQRVIYDVDDPSMPNDEGITALHNAVCAGHTEIVKFLVQFGVNVNAADSDGWTPLHCAASCNNVQVCKFLVESGAAVFATTYSDMQTAADKCEEMEDGYAQCSQFLYGVQEKMGVMNRGVVYALWDYEPQSDDELGFTEGDCMTVLRREDEVETEWWWARCGDHEGYIPRNLLGLYLRIKPRQRSLA